MKRVLLCVIQSFLVTVTASAQYEQDISIIHPLHLLSGKRTHYYRNPVVNFDFPDPNLVLGKDGYVYAYSTQETAANPLVPGPHYIPILRSKDAVHWQYVSDVFKAKPTWKQTGDLWAPDVSAYKGRYLLYYSYSVWADPNPGIGVATSDYPGGPFKDEGKLFLSSEIGVDNSIDPVFYVDHGKPYLVWGSFHGIFGIALSDDGLKTVGEKFPIAGNAFEGSFIFRHGQFYYYFGSTGSCCEGLKSTYQLKVGRADSLKGPYIDQEGKRLLDNGGTLVIQKNTDSSGFTGPGHNGDIIEDLKGNTWLVYHAYSKKAPSRGRLMLIDKLSWVNGWPQVKNLQPSTKRQRGPAL